MRPGSACVWKNVGQGSELSVLPSGEVCSSLDGGSCQDWWYPGLHQVLQDNPGEHACVAKVLQKMRLQNDGTVTLYSMSQSCQQTLQKQSRSGRLQYGHSPYLVFSHC